MSAETELTDKAIQKYMASPDHCPFCKGQELSDEGRGDGGENQLTCDSCGAVWLEITKVVDVVVVEGPTGSED